MTDPDHDEHGQPGRGLPLVAPALQRDRPCPELSHIFDERNKAVKRAIRQVIRTAHENDRKVGICGQAPRDYPEFAAFLVEAGIDSISLSPDSVMEIINRVAQAEDTLHIHSSK